MATTERGHLKVNERLADHRQWRLGNRGLRGSPHFTHISADDFLVVSDNIACGNRVTTGRQVPFCLFTDPEFARIGLSETEAKAQRHSVPTHQVADGRRFLQLQLAG